MGSGVFDSSSSQPALAAVNSDGGDGVLAIANQGNALAAISNGPGAALVAFQLGGGRAASFLGNVAVTDGDVQAVGDVTLAPRRRTSLLARARCRRLEERRDGVPKGVRSP